MHLLFWLLTALPSNVHCCALLLLQVYICSGARSTKFAAGTSMHLLFQLLITGVPVPGCGPPPPAPNGLRMRPAARGSPSCTSDSNAPTSSNANAYALPSDMFAWITRAYWLVGLLR
jgi:hypothetical protein